MKIKYLFILIITLKAIFLSMPSTIVHPFLFAKGEMKSVPASTYTWALLDIASFFVLMVVMWLFLSDRIKITKGRTESVASFVIVCGIDLLDYVLRGNSEWFMISNYPFTSNILMVIVYSLLTYNSEENIT